MEIHIYNELIILKILPTHDAINCFMMSNFVQKHSLL